MKTETENFSIRNWFAQNTELDAIKSRLLDEPSKGFEAWARTTAGIVAFLFLLQFLTGILLAFHYVPAIENAFQTIVYIEKAVPSGSWIRSLHYHVSILLPVVLIAHLAQMLARNSYSRNKTAWTFGLIFLALVLAAAATGYVLPWDARAFNGINVALSLAENTPFIGAAKKSWLQNGLEISTLTISRFYGLHAFLMPALIMFCVVARLFFFGRRNSSVDLTKYRQWASSQLLRNAISIGIVFLALAFWAAKYPAPLAPAAREAASYLSRPGPQFLWLFELQKFTHGNLAALLAFGVPAAIIAGLILTAVCAQRLRQHRLIAIALFVIGFGAVGVLTFLSIVEDARDSRTREQLAKQQQEEREFRDAPFKPQIVRLNQTEKSDEKEFGKPTETDAAKASHKDSSATDAVLQLTSPPKAYQNNCAKCHGANGEGTRLFPELKGVTAREDFKLSEEDLLKIINDAKSFGLSAKMPSFKNKLSDDEKQEIINWIRTLK